ncbi:MAG: DUF4333 domain-containing protein [Acidimicrobiia bacterium]
MRRHRILGACLLLAAGCSVDVSVSFGGADAAAAAKDLIEDDIADQAGLGPLEATCEEIDDPQPGDTFTCTATTEDGETIRFDAVMEEDDMVDVESVNLVTADGLDLIEGLAAQALEESVGATLGTENFDCGDRGLVVEPGGTIGCVLTDPATGTLYDATVTVKVLDPIEIFVEVGDPSG